MKTDQLIEALVADRTRRGRPLRCALAGALAAGGLVSLVVFFVELGVRADIVAGARHLAFRPQGRPGRWSRWRWRSASVSPCRARSLPPPGPRACCRCAALAVVAVAIELVVAAERLVGDPAGGQQRRGLPDRHTDAGARAAGGDAGGPARAARRPRPPWPAPRRACWPPPPAPRSTPSTASTIYRCSSSPGTRLAAIPVIALAPSPDIGCCAGERAERHFDRASPAGRLYGGRWRMPLHWTIDHQARRVNATADGSLAPADIKDYLDQLAAAGAMP